MPGCNDQLRHPREQTRTSVSFLGLEQTCHVPRHEDRAHRAQTKPIHVLGELIDLVSGIGMLVGFPMMLLMLVTPFPYCWGVIFVAVFALFFNTGPGNTALANVVSPGVRASAFAINIFVIHLLGDAFSPWIIGIIADKYSLATGFVVVSFTIAIGGVLWLIGVPFLADDTARAEGAKLEGVSGSSPSGGG